MSTSTPPTPPAGRYFVTGAGGFIGSHLVRRLVDARCEVIAADLAPPPTLPGGVSFARCDLRDRASLRRAIHGAGITHAVHLAAKVGDWGPRAEFEALNVEGARLVLEALTDAGVSRVVHVSSIAAMGLDAGERADETVAPLADGDAYSATKADGERVAREFQARGAPVTIVRPGDVYGIGSTPWVLRPIQLLRKRMMFLVDGGRGHFAHVHVENLLDGMLLALASPAAVGETFLLTDGDAHVTMGEYFGRLADVVGAPSPRLNLPRGVALALAGLTERAAERFGFVPPFTRPAVGFVLRRGSFSIEKARRVLGWSPRVDLTTGLRAIGEHYRGREV